MDNVLLLVLACACLAVDARVGDICHTQSECEAGECCQILSEFMVVSKRGLTGGVNKLTTDQKTGTCELYKTQGQSCGPFEKINGYCECAPGLSCHSYLDPAYIRPTQILVPRRIPAGYKFTCEQDLP